MVAGNRLKSVKGHFKKYAKKNAYSNKNNSDNFNNAGGSTNYNKCVKIGVVENCNGRTRVAYCNGSKFRNPLPGYRKTLETLTCDVKTEEIYKDPHAVWSKTDACYDKRIRSINNKGGSIDRKYNHSYKEYLRRKCKSYNSHEKRILQSDGTYKTNCQVEPEICTTHKTTIYKTTNKQYNTNSAVPSSSRIERLKYNTLMQTNKNICTSGSRKDNPAPYTCGTYSSIQKNKDYNKSYEDFCEGSMPTPCIRRKIRIGGVMRWSR